MTNEPCTNDDCTGLYEPTTDDSKVYHCRECGDTKHEIAIDHYGLLTELRQEETGAIRALADAMLTYEG